MAERASKVIDETFAFLMFSIDRTIIWSLKEYEIYKKIELFANLNQPLAGMQ